MSEKTTVVWRGPEGFLPGIGMARPGEEITMPAADAEAYISQKQARAKRPEKPTAAKYKTTEKTTGKTPEKTPEKEDES